MKANDKETQACQELQAYTRSHGDPSFIHQHVVDAWALQHADEHTKPHGNVRARWAISAH